MNKEFFAQRPDVVPTIYAYELVGVQSHKGFIKVGYTDRNVETRIKEQLHTSGVEYKILLKESAMRSDGTCFTDREIHKFLRKQGFLQLNEGLDKNEWFNCGVSDVLSAINFVRDGISSEESRFLISGNRVIEKRCALGHTVFYFVAFAAGI